MGAGRGKLVYGETDRLNYFEGNFQHGERSGVGTLEWADGRTYTGEWDANLICGNGVLRFVCLLLSIADELSDFVRLLLSIAGELSDLVRLLLSIAGELSDFVCLLLSIAGELSDFVCLLLSIAGELSD